PALGRAPDGARRHGLPVHAVARPLTGEVDALPRLDVAHGADAVRRVLHRARLSRAAACGRSVRVPGALLRGDLFPVLPADADLQQARSSEARAGQGDLP